MGMWSGKETQSFEQVRPTSKQPKYLVPAGTQCGVRDIQASGEEWQPFVTRNETGFEKYEIYHRTSTGNYYEFRLGTWVMLVHRGLVVHRETREQLEKRLGRR